MLGKWCRTCCCGLGNPHGNLNPSNKCIASRCFLKKHWRESGFIWNAVAAGKTLKGSITQGYLKVLKKRVPAKCRDGKKGPLWKHSLCVRIYCFQDLGLLHISLNGITSIEANWSTALLSKERVPDSNSAHSPSS